MSYTLAIFLLSFADPAIHARGEATLYRLSEDYSLTGKVFHGGPDVPSDTPSHLTGSREAEYWRGFNVGYSESAGDNVPRDFGPGHR